MFKHHAKDMAQEYDRLLGPEADRGAAAALQGALDRATRIGAGPPARWSRRTRSTGSSNGGTSKGMRRVCQNKAISVVPDEPDGRDRPPTVMQSLKTS